MLTAIGFLAGAALGWVRAARRGGGMADRIQYALAHAIPAALVMLVVQVVILRVGFGLPADIFSLGG